MTLDPVRLCEESGSELAKSLLAAARVEQPNHAALRSTLTAIGVGSGVIAMASAASATSGGALGASAAGGTLGAAGAAALGSAKGMATTTLLMVAKWLGAGAVAGIVATSAVYAVSAPRGSASSAVHVAPSLPRARAARAGAPVGASSKAAPEARPEPAEPPAPPAPALSATLSPPAAPLALPAPPVLSVHADDPKAPLAAELELLDAARRALAAGSAARALRSLDDYDARFARPSLLPEALYLRLEALTLKGDTPSTQVVARRLLRSYPSGPHAARARAVLGLTQ